jgi:hypothetical protein
MRPATALAAAAASLLLDNAADAAVWHVPLERHARSAASAVAEAHHRFADANAKRGSVWEPAFPRGGKHPPVPVDFRDVSMNLFAANMFFGTPPQRVSLCLDMSSSETLVINHMIGTHSFYDHAKSTTYQANGTQVKIDAGQPYEVEGFVSRDHVSLGCAGSEGRVEARDQLFVELTGPDTFLHNFPPKLDGFVGLGPRRANTTGAPSIARTMVDQQQLDRPVVGLGFDEVAAHAMFGGVDAAYKDSDIHYFTQPHTSTAWSAPVSGIQVDGKYILGDLGNVAIGTVDMVLGPADQIESLADAVGAENHALPCDGPGPNITLQLGNGFEVTLTKKDYAIPQGQGWCMFAFMGLSSSKWVLGMPFLRNVYTVLDYGSFEGDERIGFAHVKKP